MGDDGSLIGYSPSIVDGAKEKEMAYNGGRMKIALLRSGSTLIAFNNI